MKPKQTYLYILNNILGFSGIALSFFLYLESLMAYAVITLILSIAWIAGSIYHLLKQDNPDRNTSDHTMPPDTIELERPQVQPEPLLKREDLQIENTALMNKPVQEPNLERRENTSDYLNHYDSFITPSPNTILLKVNPLEMLSDNIKTLEDKMNVYGLVTPNPLYDYRFEALIKEAIKDNTIWKKLYKPFTNVRLQKQTLGGMNLYLLQASLTDSNYLSLGYLPENVTLDLEHIKSVEACFIGGDYKYLDSDIATLHNKHETLKILVKLTKK